MSLRVELQLTPDMTSKWWESLSVVNSAIRKDKTTDAWAGDLFTLTSNGQLLGSIQQHLCELDTEIRS